MITIEATFKLKPIKPFPPEPPESAPEGVWDEYCEECNLIVTATREEFTTRVPDAHIKTVFYEA